MYYDEFYKAPTIVNNFIVLKPVISDIVFK